MTKEGSVEADELVQKFLKKEDQKTLDKIVNGIEKVIKHTPAIYDQEKLKEYLTKRSALLKKLVDEYIDATISQEFPKISEEILKIKRQLLLKKNGNSGLTIIRDFAESVRTKEENKKIENKEYFEATMPLFVYTNILKADDEVQMTKIKIPIKIPSRDYYGHVIKYHSNTKTISIDAKFDDAKQNAVKENYEKIMEALSRYYSKLKESYKNPILREVLTQVKMEAPEIGIIWTPKTDELNIEPDPKIAKNKSKNANTIMPVLEIKEKPYLITTLKTKEDSVDNYLKQLTS